MKKFIEVPTKEGNKLINVNKIVLIAPNKENTVVYFAFKDIDAIIVKMSYEDFKLLLLDAQ